VLHANNEPGEHEEVMEGREPVRTIAIPLFVTKSYCPQMFATMPALKVRAGQY